MKGTEMLVTGETYNARKATILDNILVCRGLIREVNKTIKKFPALADQCHEVLATENKVIAEFMTELATLERWRTQQGLEKDEVWRGKK